MPVKKFKPTTPGRRQMVVADFSTITKKKPEKSLTIGSRRTSGRSGGSISVRHRGGGTKRKYRVIDFKQIKKGVEGKVAAIEYDPYRTAYIMLINFQDGDKRYMIAPEKIKIGQVIKIDDKAPIKPGNRMKLTNIPTGIAIYNIELNQGKGGQIVRSAGSSAVLMAKEGDYVTIKLPSSETRLVHKECFASIGVVSNVEHSLIKIGKAGRKRWMGIRPTVRGSVMNPNDHPHGGGEGKAPIGIKKGPKTPWGKKAHGVKTRRNKKTDKFITRRRAKRKRK